MRRYRGSSLKIDWQDDELMAKVSDLVDAETEFIAGVGRDIAQEMAPHDTGKLASEIKVSASKFNKNQWVIEAQGPGNYSRFYATFVELGHYSSMWRKKGSYAAKSGVYVPPDPFMRPMLRKVRKLFRARVKAALSDDR